jgi:hypothetical protein
MSLFVTTNKGRKEIECSSSWDTTSTDKFQKLATDWDGEDLIKLFSILSGKDYKAIENTHDPVLELGLLQATRFVYDTPMNFKDAPPPHWVQIKDKTIRIPVRIGDLSIGQNIHVRQALEKSTKPEGLISFVVAIYLQPLYEGDVSHGTKAPFDYHRAMELEQDVLKMPITQTYPIAAFFLRKLPKYGSNFLSKVSLKITRLMFLSTQREKI